jgi:hypothetical protein
LIQQPNLSVLVLQQSVSLVQVSNYKKQKKNEVQLPTHNDGYIKV